MYGENANGFHRKHIQIITARENKMIYCFLNVAAESYLKRVLICKASIPESEH